MTLRAPILTAVENSFTFIFSENSLDISSAKLMIHMKCQNLFSLKNK